MEGLLQRQRSRSADPSLRTYPHNPIPVVTVTRTAPTSTGGCSVGIDGDDNDRPRGGPFGASERQRWLERRRRATARPVAQLQLQLDFNNTPEVGYTSVTVKSLFGAPALILFLPVSTDDRRKKEDCAGESYMYHLLEIEEKDATHPTKNEKTRKEEINQQK